MWGLLLGITIKQSGQHQLLFISLKPWSSGLSSCTLVLPFVICVVILDFAEQQLFSVKRLQKSLIDKNVVGFSPPIKFFLFTM